MNLLINNIFQTKIAHLEVLTLHVLQKLLSLSIIVDPDINYSVLTGRNQKQSQRKHINIFGNLHNHYNCWTSPPPPTTTLLSVVF